MLTIKATNSSKLVIGRKNETKVGRELNRSPMPSKNHIHSMSPLGCSRGSPGGRSPLPSGSTPAVPGVAGRQPRTKADCFIRNFSLLKPNWGFLFWDTEKLWNGNSLFNELWLNLTHHVSVWMSLNSWFTCFDIVYLSISFAFELNILCRFGSVQLASWHGLQLERLANYMVSPRARCSAVWWFIWLRLLRLTVWDYCVQAAVGKALRGWTFNFFVKNTINDWHQHWGEQLGNDWSTYFNWEKKLCSCSGGSGKKTGGQKKVVASVAITSIMISFRWKWK